MRLPSVLTMRAFRLTFVTMRINVGPSVLFFGVPFAAGPILPLPVHRMGQWTVRSAKGAPVNNPFLRAAIDRYGRPRRLRGEAEFGMGGPITRTAGASWTGCSAAPVPARPAPALLYVSAYTGRRCTPFKSLRVSPLDGGRVAGADSGWACLVGIALLPALCLTDSAYDVIHPEKWLVPAILFSALPGFTVTAILSFPRHLPAPTVWAREAP